MASPDPAPSRRAWPTWPWLAVGIIAVATAACCVLGGVNLISRLLG